MLKGLLGAYSFAYLILFLMIICDKEDYWCLIGAYLMHIHWESSNSVTYCSRGSQGVAKW